MNKKDESIYNEYQRSVMYNLFDAYNNVSKKKWEAWEYCESLMKKWEGWGLKVISHNSYQFTAGFLFKDNDKLYLMYITKSYDRKIEVMV